MRFPIQFIFVLAAGSVLASACAHTASEPAGQLTQGLPGSYSPYQEGTPAPDKWWESFGSEELNTVVEDALKGSLTLKQSYYRLQQSGALAVKAGADRWPDLKISSEISNTRRRTDTGLVPASTGTSKKRSISLASSYELDLWGRVKSDFLSAQIDREVSEEDLYTSALSLASEVTLTWLEITSVKQRLLLIKDQIRTNLITQELIELRFRKGAASALDVFQQRQAVKETESSLPLLEASLETLKHRLAILSGKLPGTDLALATSRLPDSGPLPETGIPADLLILRPDVRSAGLKLLASRRDVKSAQADRLPAITITGSGGYNSGRWSLLFDNWFTTLAANITAPILDAGRRKAEVNRQQHIVNERLAAYRQTVLEAIGEVENAMVNEQKQTEYVEALAKRLDIVRRTFNEALERYRKGLNDYLPVLSALTSTQQLERNLVQAQFQQLSYRVSLFRSLGGRWMQDLNYGIMER